MIKYGCVVINILGFNDQELLCSLPVGALLVFHLESVSSGSQIGAAPQSWPRLRGCALLDLGFLSDVRSS